jgi:gamma-glutamyl-gamma-aminobutyrate hydrolase PuuD
MLAHDTAPRREPDRLAPRRQLTAGDPRVTERVPGRTRHAVAVSRSVPVVGLTVGRAEARWGPWTGGAFLLDDDYVEAVERAGAAAIMLPTAGMLAADPSLALDRIDALVLTGGCDVDPGTYGDIAQRETGPTDPGRDACEIALVRAAFARDLAVLATCRGMQLMNIAFGGTLRQHLPGRQGEQHRRREGEFTRHSVSLSPGSRASPAKSATTSTPITIRASIALRRTCGSAAAPPTA